MQLRPGIIMAARNLTGRRGTLCQMVISGKIIKKKLRGRVIIGPFSLFTCPPSASSLLIVLHCHCVAVPVVSCSYSQSESNSIFFRDVLGKACIMGNRYQFPVFVSRLVVFRSSSFRVDTLPNYCVGGCCISYTWGSFEYSPRSQQQTSEPRPRIYWPLYFFSQLPQIPSLFDYRFLIYIKDNETRS